MHPVYILRHVPHESAGSLEVHFRESGLEIRYFDLFREIPRQLDLDRAAGLVVMGGPMNVDQLDRFPFLAAEVDWIRQALQRRLPMLGICLGSQLLAKAAGSRVYPNSKKEIGWYRLELLPAAAKDPLFAGSDPHETVFHWHGDTFDLPPAAVKLARSPLCEQQAFRVGDCAWGLQFHIEMLPEMVDDWLTESENIAEIAALDYIDVHAIQAATPAAFPKMQQFGGRALSRFAGLCRATGCKTY